MTPKTKFLHFTPRILCITAILFVSIFAFDAFEEGKTLLQQISAFLIHLIPSFILIVLLIIAWKKELIGGIIFLLIGLGFTPFIFILNYDKNDSVWITLGIIASITLPFIIVGILFIISYFHNKKELAV